MTVSQEKLEVRRGLRSLSDSEVSCLMRASRPQRVRWAGELPAYQGGLTGDEIDSLFFADAARRLAREP